MTMLLASCDPSAAESRPPPYKRKCEKEDTLSEISVNCFEPPSSPLRQPSLVIGINHVALANSFIVFGGGPGEDAIYIYDSATMMLKNDYKSGDLGLDLLRVADNNHIYWVDNSTSMVVCYNPEQSEITWTAEFPAMSVQDIMLGPDGTIYLSGGSKLVAMQGDGSGLCRDCPWPAPEHDQQRTKRYGAELLEYLPASE